MTPTAIVFMAAGAIAITVANAEVVLGPSRIHRPPPRHAVTVCTYHAHMSHGDLRAPFRSTTATRTL